MGSSIFKVTRGRDAQARETAEPACSSPSAQRRVRTWLQPLGVNWLFKQLEQYFQIAKGQEASTINAAPASLHGASFPNCLRRTLDPPRPSRSLPTPRRARRQLPSSLFPQHYCGNDPSAQNSIEGDSGDNLLSRICRIQRRTHIRASAKRTTTSTSPRNNPRDSNPET